MAFDFSTLVTDRTQQDVAYAKQLIDKLVTGTATDAEKAEWNSFTLKGAYNATDLNRVGRAVREIAGMLAENGYNISVSPKTSWKMEDRPNMEDMSLYLRDIAAIRVALKVRPTTPRVPADMQCLNYEEANAIEKILADADLSIRNMMTIFLRSNQTLVFSGFAVYPVVTTEVETGLVLYTADGYAVYTADGLQVFFLE